MTENFKSCRVTRPSNRTRKPFVVAIVSALTLFHSVHVFSERSITSDQACCPHSRARDDAVSRDTDGPAAQTISLQTDWLSSDQRTTLLSLDGHYTDQAGRRGTLREWIDRPVVVSFFYTRCENNYKCSRAVSQLADLQGRLHEAGIEGRVKILAITFEPQFDTPDRIRRYGINRGLQFSECTLAVQLDRATHERLLVELNIPVNFSSEWVNTHGVELNVIDGLGRPVKKFHTLIWDNRDVVADLERLLSDHL